MKYIAFSFLIAFALAAGCGDDDGDPQQNEPSEQNENEGDGPETDEDGYALGCPSNVFTHVTCTGSMDGAKCRGEEWCDECEEDIATDCFCGPYDAGYRFECDDPCGECPEGGDNDGNQSSELPPWDPAGACVVSHAGGGEPVLCFEVEEDGVEDGQDQCDTMESEDSDSEWVETCPDRDAYDSCLEQNNSRHWSYEFGVDRESCEGRDGIFYPASE